jgi:hypothetical protein
MSDTLPIVETPSMADIQQLMARLATLEEENRNMRLHGSQLENENRNLRATTPPLIPALNAPAPKVMLPDKYDGNRDGYRGFVNQLTVLFALNPTRYPSDQAKIYTVGSLLTGRALSWFNPLLERPERHADTMASYAAFMTSFKNMFGPIDPTAVADNKIRRLTQGKSPVSTYASTFMQLAADLEWNEAALIGQFRAGLSGEIKDMLVRHDIPDSLDDLIKLAIRCDQRLYENRLDQRQRAVSYAPRPYNVGSMPFASLNTVPASGPVPMDLSAAQTRHDPLSAEERQRRYDNQLCFVCGEAGHRKINCPKARQNSGKVSGQ